MTMQRVLILGATSAIAQEVARLLARGGKNLLLVARSADRLATLKADLLVRGAGDVQTFPANLADIAGHARILEWAKSYYPNFDTVLLAYGTLRDQIESEQSVEATVSELCTNLVSAAALLITFANQFQERRDGCLAVITSVAGDRGRRSNYIYGSAKGGLSIFLEGLRSRLYSSGVRVLTIKPGPVKTPMTDHMRKTPFFADVTYVARDIHSALERRSHGVLYTPWFWRYIMAMLGALPETLFRRLPI